MDHCRMARLDDTHISLGRVHGGCGPRIAVTQERIWDQLDDYDDLLGNWAVASDALNACIIAVKMINPCST